MSDDKKQLIADQDIRDEKLQILEEHFPGAVEQDPDSGRYHINTNLLQLAIDPEQRTVGKEGYELRWVGKELAYSDAYSPNRKLLRPLPDDDNSKNFTATKNILIKGDNLDALKILRQNYFGKIKMIYIDPPYNRANDRFLYEDNFTQSKHQLLEKIGVEDDDIEYMKNIISARTHSAWLTFIYPRLLLARDLLTEDGIIFISIDDTEQPRLRQVCDEVFGPGNFLANQIWHSNRNIMKGSTYFRRDHEYILAYRCSAKLEKIRVTNGDLKFENPDNDPNGEWLNTNATYTNGGHRFAIELPDGSSCIRNWRFTEEQYRNGEVALLFNKDRVPRLKVYKKDYNTENKALSTIISSSATSATTTTGINSLAKLFDCEPKEIPFDNPKDPELIKYLLQTDSGKDSIVMDFFAGSGTTAQAVMELNAADGGQRRFVTVQMAEEIPPQKEDALRFLDSINKPANIFEICAERIRRAGDAIKDEKVDTGFRVFELIKDEDNKIYDVPINEQEQDKLELLTSQQVDDILYSLMAADGIELDAQVNCLQKDKLYLARDRAYIFAEIEEAMLDVIKEEHPEVKYLNVYSLGINSEEFMLRFEDHAVFIGFERAKIKLIS